jgi:hypothetical protein
MTTHRNPHTLALTCHPKTESSAVHGIAVRVGWQQEGTLAFTYTLTGDGTHLQIPSPRPPTKTDGLWQHTCFEAFISVQGESAYREFNFSPSGEWAVYRFHSYRQRALAEEDEPTPEIHIYRAEDYLTLDARLRLPRRFTTQPLRLALSAVIEDTAGTLSYWALKHPAGKPDFHHPDAFALEIAPFSGGATRKETR